MITKAIFNQQAPQHKIFKENLKKLNCEDTQSTYREMPHHRGALEDQENKENQDNQRGFHSKKVSSYFQRMQDRIHDLNEMKV